MTQSQKEKLKNPVKVSEYYKSKRKRCCYFLRGMYSILLPLLITLFIVPIYELMHEETDRLSYLRNDWLTEYPLVDIKVLNSKDYKLN